MVAAAKASGRIVQVGFQRRQSPAFREAAAYIAEGNAGRIVHVDAQIHYPAKPAGPAPQAPPASLDWDLVRSAPSCPTPDVGHFDWRAEEAYGNGHLVDWGIHWIDASASPSARGCRRVHSAGGLHGLSGRITTPDALTAHFEFDALPLVWRHRIWGAAE